MMEALVRPNLPPPQATTPSKSPSKSRSFSDPPNTLAPSPTFRESSSRVSKDDHAVPSAPPKTPRRPDFLSRGLSLQMPPRDTSMPSPANFSSRVPLSPQLDPSTTYGSPATSLPRHSRGLDFSRACTNLHHSTLAEQSSPDSSPIITQKGMMIPPRKGSVSSMVLDSPNLGPGSTWGSLHNPERSTVSSSVGSVNMLGSESGSSDSDEDASMGGDDNEDAIFTTPQVHKLQNPNAPTPFNPSTASPGPLWSSAHSPAAASLMKTIRRTRLHKGRSRKSSSSASGHSSMASPRTASPPPLRSIESASGSYFAWPRTAQSRRESLAIGADHLHLSSGNDSGDEAQITAPSTPGVVRRVVTRRGNLLPKTKGFARIRAALIEEGAPIDTDVRREAETIRQVREREGSDLSLERPQTATAASSPSLLPTVPEDQDNSDMPAVDTESMGLESAFGTNLNNGDPKGLGVNFNRHASRNSGGLEYWNRFDPSMRTPPPPNFPRHSSSSISGDVNMDSPVDMFSRLRAASTASDTDSVTTYAPPPTVSGDLQKKFKRRREDDFDIASIKRRAVSPGMSAQNSPVLTQSPSGREGSIWGQPPQKTARENSVSEEKPVRSSSGGSAASAVNVGGGKKLGLQGMVDTNDGLMKMSIE